MAGQWVNQPAAGGSGAAVVNWMPDGDFDAGVIFWTFLASESGNGLNTDGLTGTHERDATGGVSGGGALKVTWTADAAAKAYALRSTVYLPRNGAVGYSADAQIFFTDAADSAIFRVYYYAASDLDNELNFDHNAQGGVADEWVGTGAMNAWPDGADYALIFVSFWNTASAVTDHVAYVDHVAFTLLTQEQLDAFEVPAFTVAPHPSVTQDAGHLFAAS